MKMMNRLMAGVAAVSMFAAPVVAADFGYDMGLKQEAKTYGGLYYAIPFQGGTKRDTREGAKLGFQVDRTGSTALDPFAGAQGLQSKAMFDVNFDGGFNLNSLSVNGIDTVAMYDRLNANGDSDDTAGGYLPLIAVALVVGGALLVNNQDDDDGPRCTNPKDDGPSDTPSFSDALYAQQTEVKCPSNDMEYDYPED